jgi:CheY-like chemotaxis protein
MSAPRQILIIEDDAALRATMAEQILLDGEFIADEAESAAEAEAKLACAGARYDAILLDVNLPDTDGRDFCAKLRRDGRRMPVIMVTGADAEADVVRGLDAGANDYLASPSGCRSCSPGCAPSCGCSTTPRTRSSWSAPMSSAPAPACCRTRSATARCG